MSDKIKKLKSVEILDEESTKQIKEILKKLDPENEKHAVDILAFSLIFISSSSLFEMIGRMELLKQRIFAFADQPEFLKAIEDKMEEETIKRDLKKSDAM